MAQLRVSLHRANEWSVKITRCTCEATILVVFAPENVFGIIDELTLAEHLTTARVLDEAGVADPSDLDFGETAGEAKSQLAEFAGDHRYADRVIYPGLSA